MKKLFAVILVVGSIFMLSGKTYAEEINSVMIPNLDYTNYTLNFTGKSFGLASLCGIPVELFKVVVVSKDEDSDDTFFIEAGIPLDPAVKVRGPHYINVDATFRCPTDRNLLISTIFK